MTTAVIAFHCELARDCFLKPLGVLKKRDCHLARDSNRVGGWEGVGGYARRKSRANYRARKGGHASVFLPDANPQARPNPFARRAAQRRTGPMPPRHPAPPSAASEGARPSRPSKFCHGASLCNEAPWRAHLCAFPQSRKISRAKSALRSHTLSARTEKRKWPTPIFERSSS